MQTKKLNITIKKTYILLKNVYKINTKSDASPKVWLINSNLKWFQNIVINLI